MTRFALPLILATVLITHIIMAEHTEPFFNGDETRHVMTGIFVADAIVDGGFWHPKSYAERYYAQYPALGLIVWPPGFYAVEGVTMLAFGRTFETGRWLTVVYCLLACVFLFRLVKFTHDQATATIATLVFAFSREVFFHSRNVMLEVPTTAFVLMAMLFLERYLHNERRRDLFLVGLACVLAGLHRYDGALLLIYIVLRIVFAWRLRLLLRKSVLLTAFAVIVLLTPVYVLAVLEIGGVQSKAASEGTDPKSIHAIRFDQYTLFFTTLWAQIGHIAFGLSLIGMLLSIRKSYRSQFAAYWSIMLATWLFFAPMADQESRHAIYWIPAWAVWSAFAVTTLGRFMHRIYVTILLALFLVVSTAFWTLKSPVPWVRGYSAAADYSLKEIDGTGIVLFDGHFSGTIVYEMRTQDADRRLWIARADKIFYAAVSDPSHGYVEWTKDDAAILAKLEELAPDLVIVEDPRARADTPMAKRFRQLMKTHEGYMQVKVFPIASNNLVWLDGVKMIIYKPKIMRVPGERKINIPMLWQGTNIDAVIPKK